MELLKAAFLPTRFKSAPLHYAAGGGKALNIPPPSPFGSSRLCNLLKAAFQFIKICQFIKSCLANSLKAAVLPGRFKSAPLHYAAGGGKVAAVLPESSPPNPQPYTLTPEPSPPNPHPQTLNPKPSTINPQP